MNWEQKLINAKELREYLEDEGESNSLEETVAALIDQQRETWPLLRAGIEAFARIEIKRVRVDESEVVIQYNPGRIRSTAAAVDKRSVDTRPCFLCPEGLPEQEKGIAYGSDLIILCNPFPVLDRHLSIVHRQHIPQQIAGNVETLLALAHDLGSSYFVLYNGPECGASAPDHLHFQACSRELLPIEENLYEGEPLLAEDCDYCEETARHSFELFTLGGCGRSVIIFRGGNTEEITHWVYQVINELSLQTDKTEPLLNIICTYDPRIWTVYLFPRSKHRPSVYYAEGENRMVVSPGAIDMAGVVVVPERKHYDRIDTERMKAIFSEVSMNGEVVNELVDQVSTLPGSEEASW
jgi:(2Fe-2S) ferredoxin